ncbi:MAG: substrate-binding domain-containing protein [Marmoricola sp.]
MKVRTSRKIVLAAVVVLVALGLQPGAEAKSSHVLINGSGSSWAANAINQWVADVAPGLQVVFTANGAAQGRKDFANNTNDFGVSDVAFGQKEPNGSVESKPDRPYAYLPIAAGGTSLPYHVEVAGKMVRNIRLSGETVAKIFTNQITNWNDAAITKDNNGHALPSIPIIPVVHSEGAGVTNQFTRWMDKMYPSIWRACNGAAGQTQYYPLNCGKDSGPMKAQSGSDGVMNFIKNKGANGSIGMEEYSYPLLSNFPAVKLLNKAGYYTLPTQYNVAVALTRAIINNDPSSPDYLTQNLDNVYTNPDKRTYELSSYVYAIIPTGTSPAEKRETTAKRQTIADFLYYSICQGQSEIGRIGYSSLPINLVTAGFSQIAKLRTADPGVNLTNRNVSTCHNPTFIAGKPKVNHLAQIAPQPPACDKIGAGPCLAGQGAYNGSNPSDAANAAAGGGSGDDAGTGPGAGAGGTAPPVATGGGDPSLGLGATTGNGSDAAQAGAVVPTTLAAEADSGPSSLLTIVLVGLLLLVVAVPAGIGGLVVRRRGGVS